MPHPPIVLANASAAYRGRTVLSGIDLTIRAGERVALLGRSGKGKSTLIGLIQGRAARDVALVPQAAALVRTLSVFHNVYMGRLDRRSTLHNLRTLVRPARADVEAVRAVLARVDLAEALWARAGELSGGQQQRVSVARALYDGRIGLPTMGFHLESAFRQGRYGEAAALLLAFYALIGTRRLWVRPLALPVLAAASLVVLPATVGATEIGAGLARFLGHAIVPSPLRDGALTEPATWARLWAWFRPILTGQILPGTLQTLVLAQIALVATALGALALFPLTARRFAGPLGRPFGRILLVVVRSTPEYMLAYLLLQLLGPSMLPAILALAIHNAGIVGFLIGRHADGLAYRLDAPTGLNLYAYETLPRLYGQFLAYLLYRWELILREGAILGLLGVATLGFYVDAAISELRIDVAVVLIGATVLVTLTVEALSRRLRAALRIATLPTRLSRPLSAEAAG